MQITNSNINFTSRNPVIRFADDIARKINNEYPRLSSTKMAGMAKSNNFTQNIYLLHKKINMMRFDILYMKLLKKNKYLDRAKLLTDEIKIKKVGNCQESAELAEIAARVNGIKACRIAGMTYKIGDEYESLDHAVLYIDTKKPYIIDPWLGFADYLPNAIKRFQKEYNAFFDFPKKIEDCKVKFDYITEKYTPTKGELESLRENFPNLIIKKGSN